MKDVLPASHPYDQLLFPQEFHTGEASSEELARHLELADWTINALDQAIQLSADKVASKLRNDRNGVGGTRNVLQRNIDDRQL
ncbi:MAG: hypothetical protein ACHQTE_00520 [Candidatus Saccharimonadales bacterium]